MSRQPATAHVPDRRPLDDRAAASVLTYAAGEPARVA